MDRVETSQLLPDAAALEAEFSYVYRLLFSLVIISVMNVEIWNWSEGVMNASLELRFMDTSGLLHVLY